LSWRGPSTTCSTSTPRSAPDPTNQERRNTQSLSATA
jgi:hypothetical protein